MLGKVLNERYKIIKKLGKGGMALVFEAHDLLLDRQVAIKMLRPEYVTDKDFTKKFHHEAKAVARISHPNVVSIFDIARDNNYHYLVMENIEGSNLKNIINERGKLTITESLDIANQICSALIVAHKNNIVHCDIKPHNILIDDNKQVKVTDFGIARAATSTTITSTDTIMGSAHYFSPEQAKGGDIKAHSDLYSVGVVLYEMLTGQVPFTGDSPISVALKHIQEKADKPSRLNEKIPDDIDDIVMKALAKEPQKRFKNAAEMRKQLTIALKNLTNRKKKEKKIVYENDDTKIIKRSDIIKRKDKKSNGKDKKQEKKEKQKVNTENSENNYRWLKRTAIIAVLIFALIFSGVYIYNNYTDVPIVEVPDLVGMEIEEASSVVSQVGLDIEEQNEGVYNSQFAEGKIISQFPAAGERVRQTRDIVVTVSKGPRVIVAPELENKNLREVKVILSNENIGIGEIEYKYDENIAENIVISQTPGEGKEIEVEDKIDLIVSKGSMPEMVEVPNLIGLEKSKAIQKIIINDLKLGNINEEKTVRFKAGQVSDQEYDPGKSVPKNERIDLTLSKGLINKDDAEIHTSTIGIEVLGFEEQEIRIVVADNNGKDTIYNREHKPGDYVRQTINSVGPTVFKVYIDGELVKQQTIG